MTKSRIEALSDGVFAVAMTLLIFGFKDPGSGAAGLGERLLHLWPQLLSYLLSFIIVGVYWVAHHTLFHFIAKTNRALLWLNNLFLMAIAFLPFPASLLGRYASSQAAIVLYGCTLIVSNITLTLLWTYAWRAGLLREGVSDDSCRFAIAVTFAPALVYGVAVAVSWVNLKAPLVLFAAVPAFFIIPHRLIEGRVQRTIAELSRTRDS